MEIRKRSKTDDASMHQCIANILESCRTYRFTARAYQTENSKSPGVQLAVWDFTDRLVAVRRLGWL